VAPDAIPALLEQIDELLAEPAPTEEPATLARLERTLTDGYAYALELEAERWRLERRMSELAGELDEGDQELTAKELAQLSNRLSSNASVLTGLRGALARLRKRATALRSLVG
jgi:ABC-type phosphate transport system auxiliary subunit